MSKANQFVHNTKAQTDLGGVAIGAVLSLIVVGVLVFVGLSIFEGVTDSTALEAATTATTAYTASGAAVNGQIITIGSEVYTVSNTVSGAFYITNSTNASLAIAALVTEINANSTLVTASAATAANVTTITSVLSGTVGNYASTENMTSGAFTGLVMTGGAAADTFRSTSDTITTGVASSFALTAVLMLTIIAAAIIGILMVFATKVE